MSTNLPLNFEIISKQFDSLELFEEDSYVKYSKRFYMPDSWSDILHLMSERQDNLNFEKFLYLGCRVVTHLEIYTNELFV